MAPRRFMDLLAIPWVDKTIAILATIPFVIELYRRWVVGHVNFPRAVLGIQLLVIIVVMVLRSAPVRVTPNPWFWLLAFVTTYATLGFSAYAQQGVTLISPVVDWGRMLVLNSLLPGAESSLMVPRSSLGEPVPGINTAPSTRQKARLSSVSTRLHCGHRFILPGISLENRPSLAMPHQCQTNQRKLSSAHG